MKIIRVVSLVSVLLFFISCATFDKKCDVESVKKNIIVGQATKEKVLQMCGEPISRKTLNEVDVWHYSYKEKQPISLGTLSDAVGLGTEKKQTRQRIDFYFKDGVVFEVRTEAVER